MIVVRPFRAVRPIPEKASEVVCPPYDVLSPEEARERARGHPDSFLHVVKPEIDLDPSIDLYDPRVYTKGAENLKRLVERGILVRDEKSCFYIYKLRMGQHVQAGLVAIVPVEDYVRNRIKKHEHTRPEKEIDRSKHIHELNAQTGPVFLTYKAREEIDDVMVKCMETEPVYDFLGDNAVQHTLYVVDDGQLIRRIGEEFSRVEALYVADGHHRSAAATRVRDMRMRQDPAHTGEEAYNFFLSVMFPDSQVRIRGYNRVVADLRGMSVEEFLGRIRTERKFEWEPIVSSGSDKKQAYQPAQEHTFGMYLDGRWYCLTAVPGSFDSSDPIERLDVSILQENLLSPVLGIEDPRADRRIHFVGGIREAEELERLVDSEAYAVAFSLYPTNVEQLMAAADAGKVMPPKSTWFEPKLGSGMVVHMLD